jgi:pimeloyl-ACP methyl ester carboxylesterase
MREGRVRANGIEFAYLEAGEGPLALLLHGFPDSARTWSHQIGPLAEAGFRVVAPWLRGYPPTEIPRGGFYDRGTLAADLRAPVLALGGRAYLVGQDWGAIIAHNALAAFPELFHRAVVLAIPHPAEVRRSMLLPKHVQRSFHWWFFQLPELPETALAANDFAFIDYLWEHWTSPGYRDEAHLADVKRLLATPGALGAALAYYRAMLDPEKSDPALEALRKDAEQPIPVPTLALCGGDDLRAELMSDQARHFTGEYRFELVPGCGHFLHRERPAEVTRLIIDWLRR